MAGIADDVQAGFGPGAVQVPGAAQRTDDIVAALHDVARNMPDALAVAQQLIVPAQKSAVDEIMTFNARKRGGESRIFIMAQLRTADLQVAGRPLPNRPGARRPFAHASAGRGEAVV